LRIRGVIRSTNNISNVIWEERVGGGVMANDYEVLREKFRRVEIVLIRV
jgi:hypothetical protein